MRTVKWVGIALIAPIVVIVVLLASVWLFVNPNDYKAQIEQMTKDATGRELALPGAIHLSVFPWIALKLGPASLGNPPGFGRQPFASVQRVALRVKLLPLLLHRQLRIGRIEIDGLDMRLERNATGQGNWQGFGGATSATGAAGAVGGFDAIPELAGLTLANGRIRYRNLLADHVALDVGHWAPGVEVPVKLSVTLTTKPDAPPIPIVATFDFTPDGSLRQYHFATLQLRGKFTPREAGGAIGWDFSAPGSSLDLRAQTVAVPRFTLHLGDARMTGSLAATQLLGAPTMTGSLRLDPVAPRELLDHLGVTPPRTRDAKALAKLAATADFVYASPSIRLSHIDLELDDTQVRGNAAITNFATHALAFNLTANRVDLDRYLSPDSRSSATMAAKPAADPLKTLRADGELAVGDLRFDGLELSRVRVGIAAKDGIVRLAPLSATLYGGTTSGRVTVDDAGATRTVQIGANAIGVDVAPLLRDFAKTNRLSGRGNLSATLTARGNGAPAMLRSLGGHVRANLVGGAIEGIDLWSDVNRAMALWQHKALPAAGASPRTEFDTFSASADIVNGVATTKDLTIVSRQLRVTGTGSVNLPSRAIDYRLQARLLQSASARAATLADVPMTVTGTLTAPQVRPDIAGLAKASLRQVLEDKLKSLFGH
ncbi:MAG TPA: AsmA family protein [Steroidobacteraceae bacterium]|nr:AsmA family protein [Steroidobacteraceae bacterium]